jgi:hypothetical protein
VLSFYSTDGASDRHRMVLKIGPDGHCLGLFFVFNFFFHDKKKVLKILHLILYIGFHGLGLLAMFVA